MELEDLILVSVDDHVVEPPGMFEGRLPAKFADQFPGGRPPRGRDRDMALRRQGGDQHRPQRRGREAGGGIRDRAHFLRRDPTRVASTSTPGSGTWTPTG